MTDTVPDPLVPADVDLRGYEFMPLYGDRLKKSETWIMASAEGKVAALELWWHSYAHEVPAGSLPDSDRLLAQYAGYGSALRAWQAIREEAMRGWVLSSDGRYYHKFVAELVIEAWQFKKAQKERTEAARQKRLSQKSSQTENSSVTSTEKLSDRGKTALSQCGKPPVTASTGQYPTLPNKTSSGSAQTGGKEKALSTGHGGNGAAAATSLIFPEKLSTADRAAATDLLVDNPQAQNILDELQGVITGKKGCRDPMALLVTFIRQAQAGQFACSHAPRIQAEREGQAVTVEAENQRLEQAASELGIQRFPGEQQAAFRARVESERARTT